MTPPPQGAETPITDENSYIAGSCPRSRLVVYSDVVRTIERRAIAAEAELAAVVIERDKLRAHLQSANATNKRRREQCTRFRKALEFYANWRVYRGPNQDAVPGLPSADGVFLTDVTRDGGQIARQTLAGNGGEG